MGCGSSNLAAGGTYTESRGNTNRGSLLDPRGENDESKGRKKHKNLPRVEACPASISAKIGKATVRYAYMSQRGYYPDDPNKMNQDAVSIVTDFAGVTGEAHFAVYDGHGKDGDDCARFARDVLPLNMEKYVRLARARSGSGNAPDDKEMHRAFLKAHVMTNEQMHRSNKVDDGLSGTTAVSILFYDGTKISINNVGDSRAIYGRQTDQSTLQAIPLSRDQTPYRSDERDRIRKTGARILSLDQLEGLEPVNDDWGDVNLGEEIDEGGDPPRVWSPHGEYPGTAFTRSIGDMIAEELGVYAEPEIVTKHLSPSDKIIVIASDGVFEFLTNQSVIDMCAKFNDPLEACRAVIAEAYELWLQYELRTDDITMICIFVDQLDSDASINGLELPDLARTMSSGNKPVRSLPSREKSMMLNKTKLQGLEQNAEDDVNIDELITVKSDEEKLSIAEAIKASVIFQNITDAQRELLYGVMEKIHVREGEWVIKQGEYGDRFYIVESGRFEVRILPEDKEDIDGTGGNLVHTYVGSSGAHPSFGELALMYSAPRAASIVAQTDGTLWALHRVVFKQILAEKSERQNLRSVLRKVANRRGLQADLMGKVSKLVKEVHFEQNDVIVKQGATAKAFYVIMTGNGDCTMRNSGGQQEYSSLKPGDFFGEAALLPAGEYEETVIAATSISCMYIERAAVLDAIGPLVENSSNSQQSHSATIPIMKRYGAVQRGKSSITVLAKNDRTVYTLKTYSKQLMERNGVTDLSEELRMLKMMTKSICIPVIIETFKDDNFLYILFEEAVACNLRQLVDDDRVFLSEDIAKHVIMCCLDALEVIHSKGYVYNGISSESLLVSHDGYILLNNFEHTIPSSAGLPDNVQIGHESYRSPEIIAKHGIDFTSDFWAIGVLLYEIWSDGDFPTVDDKGDLQLPSAMWTRACDAIVRKLLHPNPQARLGASGTRQVKKDVWFNDQPSSKQHKQVGQYVKRYLKAALASPDETKELPLYEGSCRNDLWDSFPVS